MRAGPIPSFSSRRACFLAFALAACGARSGLDVPDANRDVPVVCEERVALRRARPSVMLAIDRSGSMDLPLGSSGMTRAQGLRSAFATALPELDERIDFGALLYPITNGELDTGDACNLAPAIDVALRSSSADAIVEAIDLHPPSGGTPTHDALSRAYEALRDRIGAFAPAVVLATDGGPNCDPADRGQPWYGLSPESCLDAGFDPNLCIDDERTLPVIDEARASGIPTYVIGVDVTLPILVEVLDAMAIAGGRPRDAERRYYDASRREEILSALEDIADDISRCTFVPEMPIDPSGTVHIDDRPEDDWELGPSGTIQLDGDTCERAQDPDAMITFGPRCG
jgi:hypothetical protein